MSQLWTRFAGVKRPSRKPTVVVVESVVEVDDRVLGSGSLQWQYSSGWLPGNGHGGAYQGTDYYALVAGSTATLRFTGTRARIRSAYGTTHGIMSISLDSGAATQIDLYSTVRLEDAIVYDTGVLADGPHTIVATCTGLKRAASTDYYTVIDRATVNSTLGGLTYGSAVFGASTFR